MDRMGTITPESGSATYLVRVPGDFGAQTVRGFNAMANAFPVHGSYFLPLHSAVEKSVGGVYYLGAMKAVIRERRDNDVRAGPAIPLIDQGVAGASTGTFEVDITVACETDVAQFRKTFAALKDAEIKQAILPK